MIDKKIKFQFPIKNTSPYFLNDDTEFVAFESQLYVSDALISCMFMLDFFSANKNIDFQFPDKDFSQKLYLKESDSLRNLLQKQDYLNDFYMVIDDRTTLYNSHRDSLSILFFNKGALPSRLVHACDQLFLDHLDECGLGFGDAGKEYAIDLLSSFPNERFLIVSIRGENIEL